MLEVAELCLLPPLHCAVKNLSMEPPNANFFVLLVSNHIESEKRIRTDEFNMQGFQYGFRHVIC